MPRSIMSGVALAAWAAGAFGQDDILIHGKVSAHSSGAPIMGALVVIASEERRDTLPTDTAGMYSAHVDYDHRYRIWYEAPGRVTKHIVIDATGVPVEARVGGHGMDIDVKLFTVGPGKDLSVLAGPMSVARYVDSTGSFEWDLVMMRRMNDRIAALLEDTVSTEPLQGGGTSEAWEPLKMAIAGVLGAIILLFGIRALFGGDRRDLN